MTENSAVAEVRVKAPLNKTVVLLVFYKECVLVKLAAKVIVNSLFCS